MQIVVHYPKSIDTQNILSQRVAEIHAKSAIAYLKSKQLPEEKTKEIIDMVWQKIKND